MSLSAANSTSDSHSVNQQDNIDAGDASSRPTERNPSFYFEDDPMAIFLVENQLFKVHRHFLIKGSEVFRDMFSSPSEESKEPDGMCDERPIQLPGVTAKEFETLLQFFYSVPQAGERIIPDAPEQLEVNLHLLSISHRFLFDGVFKYAFQQIPPNNISITERIRLGDKYGLQEWRFSAYQALLDRVETLTLEEANIMGIERVIHFLQAKEYMHQERLSIAREDVTKQANRAAYAEQQLPNRQYGNYHLYNVPPSRVPTSTEFVVKKYFSDF